LLPRRHATTGADAALRVVSLREYTRRYARYHRHRHTSRFVTSKHITVIARCRILPYFVIVTRHAIRFASLFHDASVAVAAAAILMPRATLRLRAAAAAYMAPYASC